jgi:hypothetical protein
VEGLGASVGAGCAFVTSAARTTPKDDAKTAQVETQALNKLVGLLGPAIMLSPTRVGAALCSRARADANRKPGDSQTFEVASKLLTNRDFAYFDCQGESEFSLYLLQTP